MWAKKGKQPKIPTPGGRKRQPLNGAVEPLRGRIHAALVKTLKADQYQHFLERLITRYPGKKITLYADNAKAHHSKKLEPFLETNKNKLELEFLPKYSPDLNPQEDIWRKMRKTVTHNTFFETTKDLQRALIKFFRNFKLPSQEIMSLCKNGKLFNAL
jgi:transposase